MKNKMKIVLLLTVLLMTFGTVAYADEIDSNEFLPEVIQEVEEVNLEINDMIDQALNEASTEAVELMDDSEKFHEVLSEITGKLENDVNELAAITITKAAEKGIKVYCELVEVKIFDITVWIDPLIVGAF